MFQTLNNNIPYPSGTLVAEVDVRIIGGKFTPCTKCHWKTVCVVPSQQQLPRARDYFAYNDITYHGVANMNPGIVYYHCQDYTVFPVEQRK